MALRRTERAAILIAREGLMEKLKCSEEAFLHLVRGGTTHQRSEAIKASRRGRARTPRRRMRGEHKVELLYRVSNPRPRRDRALENAIRNNWPEVVEAITPTHVESGKKLRTKAEFLKAYHEQPA